MLDIKIRLFSDVSINQCVEILYIDLRIYSDTHFIWPQNDVTLLFEQLIMFTDDLFMCI